MNDLARRAGTAVVYVGATLGAAWAGPFTTLLLFLPVALLGAAELHRLRPADDSAERTVHLLLAGAAYLAVALGAVLRSWSPLYALSLGLLLLLVRITDLLVRGTAEPFRQVGGLLFMIGYVALPLGLLPHLARQGTGVMLGVFLLVWVNDTGAYFTGRWLGRRKLLPRVSPNKTVEGLLGGVLLTLLAGWLVAGVWNFQGRNDWLSVALLVAVSSTLGDLLESALKRARGVKDSGTLLPGHGGVLDRFDGLLLAIPVYTLFLSFGRG